MYCWGTQSLAAPLRATVWPLVCQQGEAHFVELEGHSGSSVEGSVDSGNVGLAGEAQAPGDFLSPEIRPDTVWRPGLLPMAPAPPR